MCDSGSALAPTCVQKTEAMKRKRSEDLAVAKCSKRQLHGMAASDRGFSPLVVVLREYGLLESITSNLCADDVRALALTSRALLEVIIPRRSSLENLLGRVRCSGKGVQIRKARHMKSEFFYSFSCTEHARCGSYDELCTVTTKPCVTCKVATCDECRIHCVYQSIYEAPSDPNDPAELPNFSGFVLLHPFEQPILSPHHLPIGDSAASSRWEDPATGRVRPYHDQGYLDVPLQSGTAAPPEYIPDMLDFNLGRQSLVSFSDDSRYAMPSPVFASLCHVTEARKLELCQSCFEGEHLLGPLEESGRSRLSWLSKEKCANQSQRCRCTLRSRILDRWLCVKCYSAEELAILAYTRTRLSKRKGMCHCGSAARHILCLWCWENVDEGLT